MDYFQFIESCRQKEYGDLLTHKHHIIPVDDGGIDDESNIIILSVKDHCLAHIYYSQQFNRCNPAASFLLHTYGASIDWTEEEWDYVAKEAHRLNVEYHQKPMDPEVVKKIMEAKRKNGTLINSGCFKPGHKNSEYQKQRCREVHTGKVVSAYTRELLRQANLGKRHTEETKALLREKLSGPNNPNYGKPRPKEVCDAISRANQGIKPSETAIKNSIAARAGKVWYTNGTETLLVTPGEEPEGFYRGRNFPNSTGKVSYTNGEINIRVFPGEEPEGFYKGRTQTDNTVRKYYTNGIDNIMIPIDQEPPEGFTPGRTCPWMAGREPWNKKK